MAANPMMSNLQSTICGLCVFKHIQRMPPHQNEEQLYSNLMNLAKTVEFGKEYIICKGVCVCFVGKHMLETVQGED